MALARAVGVLEGKQPGRIAVESLPENGAAGPSWEARREFARTSTSQQHRRDPGIRGHTQRTESDPEIARSSRGTHVRLALAALCMLTLATSVPISRAQDLPDYVQLRPDVADPISPFVRRILQDREGRFWFGTNGDGVLRYDGEKLEGFSREQGLGGVAVRGIVEDEAGHLWIGTEGGLTRYDGTSFTNFDESDGLVGHDVWSLFLDRDGVLWIGTLDGVSRFDGKSFTPFDLPEVEPDWQRGVSSARAVNAILQDRRDRMWFATSGGVFVHDGETLEHLSVEDGLCGNSVNSILEDRDGTFWFATHHHGVCRYDGTTFTHVTAADGVEGTEVWNLYADSAGNVWFPVEHFGVYRYDGESFTRYHEDQGLTSGAIQCTYEDREGRLWFGGYLGLFRLDRTDGAERFVGVTREGPWR